MEYSGNNEEKSLFSQKKNMEHPNLTWMTTEKIEEKTWKIRNDSG